MPQNKIKSELEKLLKQKEFVIAAIDGRCASGKTTLAESLKKELSCNVIHADDFFLRPEQRTRARLDTPGENIDHERLLSEVLIPLSENRPFFYRPYICKSSSFGDEISVFPNRITLVEGSYSCHPSLVSYYDLKIFLDIESSLRWERIQKRNPHNADDFKEKWIPLEEKYFETFKIREKCELIF